MIRLLAVLLLLNGAAMAETRSVAALAAPIEIVTDREGIPHITAATIEDAFFGQGYAAASARLWQMDIGRRRALGRRRRRQERRRRELPFPLEPAGAERLRRRGYAVWSN